MTGFPLRSSITRPAIAASAHEPHLDAFGRAAFVHGDARGASLLVAAGRRLDVPLARGHVVDDEGAVVGVDGDRISGRASVGDSESHAHAPHGRALVADLEVEDGLPGVRVDHRPADPSVPRDHDLHVRGGHDPGLARSRPVLAEGRDLVGFARGQPLEHEGAVGPRPLGRPRPQQPRHRPGRAALGPHPDDPSRQAVAGLVAHGPGDRGTRAEHEHDGLDGAALRDLQRVDALARHPLLARRERVVARAHPAELEAAVRARRLLRRLPGSADERHLGHVAAAASALEHPRAAELHVGSRERPVVLVLHEAPDDETARQHDGHPGLRASPDERDAAERSGLEVVVANGETDVGSGREARGLERAVAGRSEHGPARGPHEHPERALAGAHHEPGGALEGSAVGVEDASRERRRAHERHVLCLRLSRRDGDARAPGDEAGIVGAQAAGPGREAPNLVASVGAGPAGERRGSAAGDDSDPREGSGRARVHHATAGPRGGSEHEGSLRGPLRRGSGGPSLLSRVGHERARRRGDSVDQEGSVAPDFGPARRRLALESDEGAGRGRPAIGDASPCRRPLSRGREEWAWPKRRPAPLPNRQWRSRRPRREAGSPLPSASANLNEPSAAVVVARETAVDSSFHPAARAQRDRGRDHRPPTPVHHTARENGGLRHRHVPEIVALRCVEDAREIDRCRSPSGDAQPDDARRRRQNEAPRPVRLRGHREDGLRLVLTKGLAARLHLGGLEGQGGDRHAAEGLVFGQDPPP